MGTDRIVCRPYICPIPYSSLRIPCSYRIHSATLHGAHSNYAGKEEDLDLPLQRIRAMERNHHFLGVQRNYRRRYFCHLRQRVPDVSDIRSLQVEQETFQGSTSIYFPDGGMDFMGAILL